MTTHSAPSVKSIIERAVQITDPFDHSAYFKRDRFSQCFDPEHVALMEAVVEAADAYHAAVFHHREADDTHAAAAEEGKAYHLAVRNLDTYRKQRGLAPTLLPTDEPDTDSIEVTVEC